VGERRYYKLPLVLLSNPHCGQRVCVFDVGSEVFKQLGCRVWVRDVLAQLLIFGSEKRSMKASIRSLCYSTPKGVRCVEVMQKGWKRPRVFVCLDDVAYALGYGLRKLPAETALHRMWYAIYMNLAALQGVKQSMLADLWLLARRAVYEYILPQLIAMGVLTQKSEQPG